MLVTTKEMLQKAYEGRYAVAAVNTQGGTYDIIRAVAWRRRNAGAGDFGPYLSTGRLFRPRLVL